MIGIVHGTSTPLGKSRRFALLWQFVRFGLVGGAATLLYGALALAIQWLLEPAPLATHVVAYALAIPFSFVAQRGFTFRYRGPPLRSFVRFATIAIAAFAVSTLGVYLNGSVYGLPPIAGTATTMLIVPLVSYVSMRLWVFNDGAGRQ